MKVNRLFYAAACLMTVAACTNEEFTTNEAKFDGKGELVELKGGLALTKGNIQTRALDENGKFIWMPSGTLGDASLEIPEKIGLCWTGVNNTNPDKAPATATGDMVYTNYEFVHSGWLYEDEDAPEFDPCAPYDIKNGEYNTAANNTTGVTAIVDGTTSYKAATGGKTLDLTTGFFNTKNTAIYSGEYIVYFPYNSEFFDSPIVATTPRTYELNPAATNDFEVASKYNFNVGYVNEFQGGQFSDVFSTKILTGATYIALKNSNTTANKDIKQIVLYAAGENDNFIIKQELSAKAIKAANNVSTQIGTGLYLGEAQETSKTIVANYATNKTVNANTVDAEDYAYVILPVLPTTISDLKILLVDDKDKVATVDCGQQEIKSLSQGNYSVVKLIDLDEVEFKADYVVTDGASMTSVLSTIASLGAGEQPTAEKPITVQVIGDVTLSANAATAQTWYKYVTFEGGKIIVPADKTFTLQQGVTIKSDIDVMDKGCCGNNNGKLQVNRATLTGTINNRGDIQVGVGSTATEIFMNNATLNNLKGVETVRGVEVEYEGTINVVAKTTLNLNGTSTILNEGKITTTGTGVTSNDGTITLNDNASIDNQGSIVNGGNMNILSSPNGLKNTTAESEFVDKVGSQLTGHGMNSDNEGEFVCEVDAQHRYNTALTSSIRPTTIVRFIDAAYTSSSTHDSAYEIAEGDVKSTTGNLVSFEVVAAGKNIKFTRESGILENNEKTSTIKSLKVVEAASVTIDKLLTVNTTADFEQSTITINKNFVVVEGINIGKKDQIANVTVSEKVNVNATGSKCDLKVLKESSLTLNNDGKSYYNNINNNGSVNIEVATTSPKVAHELWCNSFTTGADGKWANNSYPMIIK